jgi:carboxymethylenebutenolidase
MTAPSYNPVKLTPTLSIQGPLSRRGTGPGLLIIQVPTAESSPAVSRPTLDPEPLQKWAEESYAVARVEIAEYGIVTEPDLRQAIDALARHDKCTSDSYGVIGKKRCGKVAISVAS